MSVAFCACNRGFLPRNPSFSTHTQTHTHTHRHTHTHTHTHFKTDVYTKHSETILLCNRCACNWKINYQRLIVWIGAFTESAFWRCPNYTKQILPESPVQQMSSVIGKLNPPKNVCNHFGPHSKILRHHDKRLRLRSAFDPPPHPPPPPRPSPLLSKGFPGPKLPISPRSSPGPGVPEFFLDLGLHFAPQETMG